MNVVAYGKFGWHVPTLSRLKNQFFGLLYEAGLGDCTAEAQRAQRKFSQNGNLNKPSVNSVLL
jgi:hypothetical protein